MSDFDLAKELYDQYGRRKAFFKLTNEYGWTNEKANRILDIVTGRG